MRVIEMKAVAVVAAVRLGEALCPKIRAAMRSKPKTPRMQFLRQSPVEVLVGEPGLMDLECELSFRRKSDWSAARSHAIGKIGEKL
ncbi:hypothetical protein [Chthonobacter rhizosphaerae]|uniref:hypothetical protein n=1 Tax=Chthonobacter rhizosphaerae TaxID=2735553 RepID=UPI0015EEE914|nr:hypothetical protein [Chthonobacter rhizosphaerae]